MLKEYKITKSFFENYPNGKWKNLKEAIGDSNDILPAFLRARQLENGYCEKKVGGVEDKYLRHIKYLNEAIDVGFYTLDLTTAQVLKDLEIKIENDNKVLLLGESGVGKEFLAKVIAKRKDLLKDNDEYKNNFVTVNCASLGGDLLRSELFGHSKGSFTGALFDKRGLIDEAEGGMLFLDEVHALPPSTQRELLWFLQSGKYRRIGETKTRKSNAKIIFASNLDLHNPIIRENNNIFHDFYHRISMEYHPFTIPPIRDRRSDIPFMIFKISQDQSKYDEISGISDPLLACFMMDPFPGNGRDLKNILMDLWMFEGKGVGTVLEGENYFLRKQIHVEWGKSVYIKSAGQSYSLPHKHARNIKYLPKMNLVQLMKNYSRSLPKSVVRQIKGETINDTSRNLRVLAQKRMTLDDIKGLYCLEVEKDRNHESDKEIAGNIDIDYRVYKDWVNHGRELELKEKV